MRYTTSVPQVLAPPLVIRFVISDMLAPSGISQLPAFNSETLSLYSAPTRKSVPLEIAPSSANRLEIIRMLLPRSTRRHIGSSSGPVALYSDCPHRITPPIKNTTTTRNVKKFDAICRHISAVSRYTGKRSCRQIHSCWKSLRQSCGRAWHWGPDQVGFLPRDCPD